MWYLFVNIYEESFTEDGTRHEISFGSKRAARFDLCRHFCKINSNLSGFFLEMANIMWFTRSTVFNMHNSSVTARKGAVVMRECACCSTYMTIKGSICQLKKTSNKSQEC